jgi:septum formation protein
LRRLHLDFEVLVAGVDETPVSGEGTRQMATRLALAKAKAVAPACAGAWIIGSDQVADLAGEPVGKPGNRPAAEAQLRRLSGKRVDFHTAICLLANGRVYQRMVTTGVTYRDLSPGMISRYLDLEPAFDCAGSAKSEGLGIALLSEMSTPDPTALIGLPLIALTDLLSEAGHPPLA